MENIELYAKDKNLLQLGLFYFGKEKPKEIITEWEDSDGKYKLVCSSRYGVPGALEQDVYTATTRLWVKQGMPERIKVNYSDIARELGLSPKSSTTKIKNSLKKLGQARYEFEKCFVLATEDGTKKITTQFSLYDRTSLYQYEKGKSKRRSMSELVFPVDIRNNLEKKYYQLLDMKWYRALPEGLPRRLYEYLAKRRYHGVNGVFTISENIICRWLPILDKHTTNRRKRLKKITNYLIDAGYLKEYDFDRKKKLCLFTYAQSGPPIEDQIEDQSDNQEQEQDELLQWLFSIPNMTPSAKMEIANRKDFREKCPEIMEEYQRQAGKITNAGAWIRAAFKEGYKKKEAPVDKQEQENQIKLAIQEQCKIYAEKEGARYQGKTITNIFSAGFFHECGGPVLFVNCNLDDFG